MQKRLKQSEVAATREALLKRQGGLCALTGYPLSSDKAVLDHCHTTGLCRGVIHRGVNALLGKLENNHKRYGVSLPQMVAMGPLLGPYLLKDYSDMPLHYTFKSEDEKRILRNTRAKKARAAKKVPA